MRLAVLLVLVAGVAEAGQAQPTAVQTTLLVTAELTLAVDAFQTLYLSSHPWGIEIVGGVPRLRPGYAEINPILGRTPSRGAVLGYFSSAMLLTAGLWCGVPRFRVVLPAAVAIFETVVIARNGVIMHWQFGF